MRNGPFWFLFVLSAGCEPCLDYANTATCVAPEAAQGRQNQADNNAPNVALFTWSRQEEALAPETRMLSLRATCADVNGNFLFIADSRNYEGNEVDEIKGITLVIPYGNHPDTAMCFVLLRENENETPMNPTPPGNARYTIDNEQRNAVVIDAGQFSGFWQVDIP